MAINGIMSEGQPSQRTDLHDADELNEATCVICLELFSGTDGVTVRTKGLSNLIHFSEVHGDERLTNYLVDKAGSVPVGKVLVHAVCRKWYTDTRGSSVNVQDEDTPKEKRLRSDNNEFMLKENCFICGHAACRDLKHPDREAIQLVETLPIWDKIVKQCDNRNDPWANDVRVRVEVLTL